MMTIQDLQRSLSAVLLVAALGCSDSSTTPRDCPAGPDAGINPGFVIDREIQSVIQYFQVTLLSDRTKSGASVTCSDVPGSYRLGDPRLTILGLFQVKRKKGGSEPEIGSGIKIPTDRGVLIIAEGVARDSAGNGHIVARACSEKTTYHPCSTPVLTMNLIATTGSACNSVNDCEPNMTCLKGTTFIGGYCATTNCMSGARCPPGSSCVGDSTYKGVCMRKCSKINDCISSGIQPQMDCICRRGPVAGGKAYVCADAKYKPTLACITPDAGI